MLKIVAAFAVGFAVAMLFFSPARSVFAQSSGVVSAKAEPIVPPLEVKIGVGVLNNDIQQLDGIACDQCVITARVVTYAGGQYECGQCKLNVGGFMFKGAALNTVNLLAKLGVLKGQPASPQNTPNGPNIRTQAFHGETFALESHEN